MDHRSFDGFILNLGTKLHSEFDLY